MTSDDLVRLTEARFVIPGRLKLVVPSLRIRRGEVAVMIGPNGSGKSTLARFICRIAGAETVQIESDLRPAPAAVMVWQTLNLFPLTVARNVSLVREMNLETALQHFNLWALRDSRAEELSGGEQQKLAVVRSLVANAELLVLDEPTSSLDSRSIDDLVRVIGAFVGLEIGRDLPLLSELYAKATALKKAVLVITHDARLVRALGRFREVRLFSLGDNGTSSLAMNEFHLNAEEGGGGYSLERVHLAPPDLYSADFFGLPNLLGYTSTVGDFRGANDFCSRYRDDAVGWLMLRDNAIRVQATKDKSAHWNATVVGFEHLGGQRRARIAVEGMFGPYEVTVPAPKAFVFREGQDVFLAYDLEHEGAWRLVSP